MKCLIGTRRKRLGKIYGVKPEAIFLTLALHPIGRFSAMLPHSQ